MKPDLKQTKRILIALAEYYNQQLSETQLGMYAEDLSEFSAQQVNEAALAYRRDPKHTRFPLPAALAAAIRPPLTDHDLAVDIADRICTAISSRGYTWPDTCLQEGHATFDDALRAHFGNVGVAAVKRSGGWARLHDEYYAGEHGVFKAQLRNSVESALRLSKAGHLRGSLALPTSNQPGTGKILKLTGDDTNVA